MDYEKIEGIRNSDLGYFLISPKYYNRYVLNRTEEDKKTEERSYYLFGRALHCKVLEEEEFDDRYTFFDGVKPKSANQKKFVNNYIKAYQSGIVDDPDFLLSDSYLNSYSVEGVSEAEVLRKGKKVYLDLKGYIDMLISKEKKEVLTKNQFDDVLKCTESLKQHKLANELLYDKSGTNFNEKIIQWVFGKLKMKSRIDRVIIDDEKKIIKLIEVKTTHEHLKNYPYEFEKYDVAREVACYSMALTYYLPEHHGINISDYRYEVYVVVVQSGHLYESEVFYVNSDIILKRVNKLTKTLEELKWHYSKDLWEHNRDYYQDKLFKEI